MNWFCKNLDHSHHIRQLQALGQKGSYWIPGQEINIYFLSGTSAQKAMYKSVISKMTWCNLKFKFIDSRPESDIRIDFNPNDGAWSYVGTQNIGIGNTQPTMNLGWDGIDVYTHETGHMIGGLHELSNPLGHIDWFKNVVYQDLSGPPNNWSHDIIDDNVFFVYDQMKVDATPLDIPSILRYPILDKWHDVLKDGLHLQSTPQDWSIKDIGFWSSIYSFDNPYMDMLKNIFLKSGELSHLTEGELVRIGQLIGVNTAAKLTKVQNLELVKNKLFK